MTFSINDIQLNSSDMAWREANFSIWIWEKKLNPLDHQIRHPGRQKPTCCQSEGNLVWKHLYMSEAAERVILFAVEQLSLFSLADCDHTWCSFSWTTGMRVSSSVHWVSMRARSDRSTTVSTFFRRSSWLPSVTTELFRLDLPSTSFENSWDRRWQQSTASMQSNHKIYFMMILYTDLFTDGTARLLLLLYPSTTTNTITIIGNTTYTNNYT